MVKNKYGIRNISIDAQAKCYCPLGRDWYTNHFTIDIEVAEDIPDYVELDKWIAENINGRSLIIEEATAAVYQHVMENYQPYSCAVRSYVDDAAHSPVTVTI